MVLRLVDLKSKASREGKTLKASSTSCENTRQTEIVCYSKQEENDRKGRKIC